jgi:hypothetical protein
VAAQLRDRFHLVPPSSAWCQRLGCHSGYQVAPYAQRPGGGMVRRASDRDRMLTVSRGDLAPHRREPLVLGGHPGSGPAAAAVAHAASKIRSSRGTTTNWTSAPENHRARSPSSAICRFRSGQLGRYSNGPAESSP